MVNKLDYTPAIDGQAIKHMAFDMLRLAVAVRLNVRACLCVCARCGLHANAILMCQASCECAMQWGLMERHTLISVRVAHGAHTRRILSALVFLICYEHE